MQKVFEGKIISLKMNKSVVVEVTRKFAHPLYRKVLKRSKKYKADSGELNLSLGEKVKIAETRPTSKEKHFKVLEVIK